MFSCHCQYTVRNCLQVRRFTLVTPEHRNSSKINIFFFLFMRSYTALKFIQIPGFLFFLRAVCAVFFVFLFRGKMHAFINHNQLYLGRGEIFDEKCFPNAQEFRQEH